MCLNRQRARAEICFNLIWRAVLENDLSPHPFFSSNPTPFQPHAYRLLEKLNDYHAFFFSPLFPPLQVTTTPPQSLSGELVCVIVTLVYETTPVLSYTVKRTTKQKSCLLPCDVSVRKEIRVYLSQVGLSGVMCVKRDTRKVALYSWSYRSETVGYT